MVFRYEVQDRPSQRYVAFRAVVPMDRIGSLADRFGELFGWLGARSVEATGAPFLRYRELRTDGQVDLEAGVPVAGEVKAEGEVRVDVLPAGKFLVDVHTGPYSGLVAATAALLDWARDEELTFDSRSTDHGDEWACRLEFYPIDPRQQPDPQKWVTELAFKLA